MSDSIELKKAKRLKGVIVTPPDKSISHRAIILSALSKGKSIVKNFLCAEDTMSTLNAFRRLGIGITEVRSQSPSATRRGGKSEVRSSATNTNREGQDKYSDELCERNRRISGA